MSKVKIDKNIAIPYTRAKHGANKNLLLSLEIGDSVLLPDSKSRAWNVYYNPAKRLGITITILNTPEGVRMWRVK